MPTWFFTTILALLPGPLGLVLVAALGAAFFAWLHWDGALKEPGPDRIRLIGFLRRGGDWRWRYTRMVRRALNASDRFLGDADKPVWNCRWLTGEDGPWPCWSGWSFDRCALLAVVYPVASLFATWVLSGEAGDIGALLGLEDHVAWWRRAAGALTMVPLIFTTWKFARADGRAAIAWGAASTVAVAGAVAVAVDDAVAVAVDGAVAVAVAGAGAVAVFVAVVATAKWAVDRGRLAAFWGLWWPIALLGYYGLLSILVRDGVRTELPTLLVMLAIVPLVNVPFDFLSIGFTRGLLRRGSAARAHPSLPFLLGLLDLAVGLLLLAGLACAMIADPGGGRCHITARWRRSAADRCEGQIMVAV